MKRLLLKIFITAYFILVGIVSCVNGQSVHLSIPDITVHSDSTFSIEVWLDNSVEISGILAEITFDESLISLDSSGITTTSRSQDMNINSNVSSNIITYIMYSTSGKSISVGNGPIVTIECTAPQVITEQTTSVGFGMVSLTNVNNSPVEYTKTEGLMTIVPEETVSAPTSISVPASISKGEPAVFKASGASSSYVHSLEYRFDWGDGTISSWGGETRNHTWNENGTYNIKAQARCSIHQDKSSSWSGIISIQVMSIPLNETPDMAFGETSGFGTPFGTYWISGVDIGNYREGMFEIVNRGEKELIVNRISSNNSEFEVRPTSMVINPGQSKFVSVIFKPRYTYSQSQIMMISATITIFSNDPEKEQLNLTVGAAGLDIPTEYKISNAYVRITSPNGGEYWNAGTLHNITWLYYKVTNVTLEYSTNNGSTYTTIVASTAASAGSYQWTIPSTASTQYLVRISDASNAAVSDVSNTNFTIIISPVDGAKLTTSAPTTASVGSQFVVEVKAQEVTNLFGGSFILSWTQGTYIDYVKTEQGDFLGSDIIFYPSPDESGSKVAIGISKKAGSQTCLEPGSSQKSHTFPTLQRPIILL